MKYATKLTAGILGILTLGFTGVGLAATIPPALPTEQQALVSAGFTKAKTWAKFDKQHGDCHITVEKNGKNYYIVTSGKLKASLYPVIPKQVVSGAALMDANCQG